MPHAETKTARAETETSGIQAEIVRSEPIDGNIRVRCPVDLAEMEVPSDATRAVCDIGGEELIVQIENPANQTSHK